MGESGCAGRPRARLRHCRAGRDGGFWCCCVCPTGRCCMRRCIDRPRRSGRCSTSSLSTAGWFASRSRSGAPSRRSRSRQHVPWPWLSELFCGAYYAYYFFTPAMLFTVVLTRGYAAAERVIFTTTLCFCVCYTLFWLFPTDRTPLLVPAALRPAAVSRLCLQPPAVPVHLQPAKYRRAPSLRLISPWQPC